VSTCAARRRGYTPMRSTTTEDRSTFYRLLARLADDLAAHFNED
jgi:hypothetical protein